MLFDFLGGSPVLGRANSTFPKEIPENFTSEAKESVKGGTKSQDIKLTVSALKSQGRPKVLRITRTLRPRLASSVI